MSTATAAASKRAKTPQGLLPAETSDSDRHQQAPAVTYPTVIEQARQNMLKYNNCVLLTKVGSFYEMYFDQAEELGPLLALKLASKRTSVGPVPMAGFPAMQLERYLKILVEEHGRHVAISEEQRNDVSQKVKTGGLEFNREVKRIVTAGTLIDEQFLRPLEHNYLLAVHVPCGDNTAEQVERNTDYVHDATRVRIGLAWIDLSSGEFATLSTNVGNLSSTVSRLAAREVVLETSLQHNDPFGISAKIEQEGCVMSYHPHSQQKSLSDWSTVLGDTTRDLHSDELLVEEAGAVITLLEYAQSQLPGLQLSLQRPVRQDTTEYMGIDKNSLRGLEILRTLRDGSYTGSLLHAIRRTSTESGARLLSERLTAPSMSLSIINDRLDLVQTFISHVDLLEDIVPLLKKTADTLRIVQRFSFGRGHPDDLLALSRTITLTKMVAETLRRFLKDMPGCMETLLDTFEWTGPTQLSLRISEAIDEDGLMARQRSEGLEAAESTELAQEIIGNESDQQDMASFSKRLNSSKLSRVNKQGTSSNIDDDRAATDEIWVMRREASPTLSRLHQSLEELRDEKSDLAITLRQQLGASSLTLKFAPGLGHICHLKGKDTNIDLSPFHARVVSSSKSTRSFYLPTWTKLGTRIEEGKSRIRAEETALFASLREDVIRNLVSLRRNAGLLDEIDVACSSARLAGEYNLARPILTNTANHEILQGRHLTVEQSLSESSGRTFTPNDCVLKSEGGKGSQRIQLVTGPNMAGKSTFLRQTALISILAQVGSYVPAAYASIGMVDKIFSRVGSADNLAQDQSTFMVEMLETAEILRNATPKSFVIMDEVGRGTTPEDGIAVGFAVLKHLWETNQCRSLFATHFHVLADMTKGFEGVGCYCTDVIEEEGGLFRYDHRMRPGVNRQSHALKVAKLAGMPHSAVETAGKVLSDMKVDGIRT
ncbi:MAG: DNA mismatch repair ATPase msh1 [Chrysothrix sp. TS-e1954]|nr:MAG: DNA mismatch repair ATPase msh1 [Chrysothrix sp. TS-e1954]